MHNGLFTVKVRSLLTQTWQYWAVSYLFEFIFFCGRIIVQHTALIEKNTSTIKAGYRMDKVGYLSLKQIVALTLSKICELFKTWICARKLFLPNF